MLILSKTLRPNKKNKLQDGREQKKIYTRKQVEGLGAPDKLLFFDLLLISFITLKNHKTRQKTFVKQIYVCHLP